MDSLISIIIPVYMVEKYIDRCIQSVVNQTYQEIEIILVDDGSPDHCSKICDEWSSKDNRIIVLHKTNGGLSSARNYGLNVCKGEYVTFVDSDDYIAPEFLRKLYDNLVDKDADIAICNYCKVYDGTKAPNNSCESTYSNFIHSGKKALECMENDHYSSYYVVAWNKLYKRKLFDKLRYPINKCFEDQYVIHELLYSCNKVIGIKETMYYYVQRQGSIMSSLDDNKRLDIIDYHDRRTYFYNNHEEYYLQALNQIHLRFLYNEYGIKDREVLKKNQDLLRRSVFKIIVKPNIGWRDRFKFMLCFISLALYSKVKVSRDMRKSQEGRKCEENASSHLII